MADQTYSTNNMNDTKKKKTGLALFLTVIAYVLIIVFVITIAPVVCPLPFGYHTRVVKEDYSGDIGTNGTVVYAKAADSYTSSNRVAVEADEDGSNVYVAFYKGEQDGKVTLEKANGSFEKNKVVGKVVAKTPFIGYLCQLCFSIVGKVITGAMFVIGLILMIISNKIAKKNNEIKEAQKNA